MSRIQPILRKHQSTLHRGFTEDVSPLFAALILIEVVNEYSDKQQDLSLILLDAEKAFDKVWHAGLHRKLADLGIPGDAHRLLSDWYRGFRSQVRWANRLSPSFTLFQGTIQGSSISPELFKVTNNDALTLVQKKHLGAKIGTTCCATPTCADDIAILAPRKGAEDLTTLEVVVDALSRSRIIINHNKTELLRFGRKSLREDPEYLSIYGNPLTPSEKATHLGVLHCTDKAVNDERVKARIKGASRAMYSLFGAGLHGRNGLNPVYIRSIWVSYILPVLLYGTELWAFSKNHINKLEAFQQEKLRQLQNLPKRTAKQAVRGLLGLLPVEAEIHL